ncbi:MAG: 1-acyl-sn-glycerol-3-phosphate acyltransferase, partial [Saprospiraceae bacterium]
MLLYRLIKPYSTLGVKTFFKKVYFHNDYHIPKDKPVLITCNHPTAFMDPVIMACMLKDPIHFMVRGDVFKKPFFKKVLQSLNMIPIFRFKEGYANIKQNYASMDYVSDLLAQNQHVVIFAEGLCLQEKRLKPIQKGTARMAFSAIEKHGDLDIHIVPAAVNYTFKTQVRDVVKYEFGEPIRIADYRHLYVENANKAIKEITDEIERRMR